MLFREEIKPPTAGILAFSVRRDASADEIMGTLKGACEAYKNVAHVTEQIKLVIGKTLAVVQDRKLFGKHKNFEAFLRVEIVERYGIGRSTAWEAIKVAKAFPDVDAEGYQRIGAERMIVAARTAVKLDAAKRPALNALLNEGKPLDELKTALHELSGVAAKPEVASLMFRVNPTTAAEWRQWCDQPEVIEAAGGNTTEALFTFAFHLAREVFRPKGGRRKGPQAVPHAQRQGVA